MKANELMLGDWVMLIDDETGNDYKKAIVEHIDKRGRIGLRTETGSLAAWNIEHIEPVPITPEILEKNGFKKLRISWILRDGYMGVSFQYLNGKWSIDIRNEFAPKDELGRCDLVSFARAWYNVMYVHELQHAIRLLGIEKEIVL